MRVTRVKDCDLIFTSVKAVERNSAKKKCFEKESRERDCNVKEKQLTDLE